MRRLSLVLLLAAGATRAQDVVITEIMASNVATLEDDDGDSSDWI